MDERKFLNEEKYKRNERTITVFAVLVLIIGLGIGGFLIYRGIAKPGMNKVEELQKVLLEKKSEIEAKGVEYNSSAKYTDGEEYDLKIITDALDPSFDNCAFDEYKNNAITKEYCAARNATGDFASTSQIMIGAFICIVGMMISGFLLTVAKQRSILAFQAQGVMPVAKEGIEEMTPTLSKAAKELSKSVKDGFKD